VVLVVLVRDLSKGPDTTKLANDIVANRLSIEAVSDARSSGGALKQDA